MRQTTTQPRKRDGVHSRRQRLAVRAIMRTPAREPRRGAASLAIDRQVTYVFLRMFMFWAIKSSQCHGDDCRKELTGTR